MASHGGIVFLVRPNGFDIFQEALPKARKASSKIAYEPVDADWNVDLNSGRG
jgi:hypothetical protein